MNLLWIILGLAGARLINKRTSQPAPLPTSQPNIQPAEPEAPAQSVIMPTEPEPVIKINPVMPEPKKPEQSVIMPTEDPEVIPIVPPAVPIIPPLVETPQVPEEPVQNVIMPTEPDPVPVVVPSQLGGNYPVQIINNIEVPVFPYDPANFTSPYQVQSGKFPKRPFKRDYLSREEVFAYFAVNLSTMNLDKVTWQLARDVYKAYTLSDRLDYYLFLNKMKEDYYTGRVKPVSLGLLKPGIYRAPHDIGMLQVYDSYVGVRYYTGNFVEDEILKFPKLRGWGTYKLVGSEKVHSLHPNSALPGLSSDQWNYYQWIAVNKSLFNVRLDNSLESQLDRLIYAFNANLEHYNLTEWTINSL